MFFQVKMLENGGKKIFPDKQKTNKVKFSHLAVLIKEIRCA